MHTLFFQNGVCIFISTLLFVIILYLIIRRYEQLTIISKQFKKNWVDAFE
jgi:hypothetical protein